VSRGELGGHADRGAPPGRAERQEAGPQRRGAPGWPRFRWVTSWQIMGLLDDAIREHLELKLRRGADAGEVSREEHEALSPVRREPTSSDAEPLALGPEDDFEPATELSPLPAGAPDDDYGYDDEDYEDDDELEPVGPAHGPGGSVPAATVDVGETEEWGFEDAEEDGDEPAEGEDVLEQTPEFLSETPEHDRLWFEQKPPRDFDFDG